MLCRNPYVSGTGLAYGCGQCMPCRYNKRRIWMHRIMLEAAQYDDNAFVTLTYNDENLPAGGTLVMEDYKLWLKRLRDRVAPSRFRYFLVGEYGDESERPHYHAALFGFKSCEFGQSTYTARRLSCCYWCDLVRDTWGKGNVYLGRLEDDSAGYMAGYVTKKMTHKDDVRLKGRMPEFGRMSLKPGIGFSALWDIADALMRHELENILVDVPDSLQHGDKKKLPLGRYLRRRLRELVGKNEVVPQEVIDQMVAEMLPVRLAARSSEENPSIKSRLIEDGAQKVRNMEARLKLKKKGKLL